MTEYTNYLCHHGVKGQKWGVRHEYQPVGRRAIRKAVSQDAVVQQYKSNMIAAKAQYSKDYGEYNKAYNKYAFMPTKKNKNAYDAAVKKSEESEHAYKRNKFWYKTKKEEVKISASGKEFGNKSKHRQRLEAKYMEKGLTAKEAEAAANNRIKVEKTLAVIAGVTIAAAAAYYGTKYVRNNFDSVLKAGTKFQRIKTSNEGKLHDVFYASMGKHDNNRYLGMMGKERFLQGANVYKLGIKNTGSVKVASPKHALEEFSKLVKNNEEFKESVERYAKLTGKSMDTKAGLKSTYEMFNKNICTDRRIYPDTLGKVYDTYFNALRSKGYGAIHDINDMRLNDYNTKHPLIFFDETSKFVVNSITQLDKSATLKQGTIEHTKAIGELAIRDYLPYITGISATAAVGTYTSKINKHI